MYISVRETYKTLDTEIIMDKFTAVGLAEGFIDGSEEEVLSAWQYLHSTGLAYQLQGWFGRTAQALLQDGLIS